MLEFSENYSFNLLPNAKPITFSYFNFRSRKLLFPKERLVLLSVAIFCAEPRHKRIFTSIRARSESFGFHKKKMYYLYNS